MKDAAYELFLAICAMVGIIVTEVGDEKGGAHADGLLEKGRQLLESAAG